MLKMNMILKKWKTDIGLQNVKQGELAALSKKHELIIRESAKGFCSLNYKAL